MMVLMRPPMPVRLATLVGVDGEEAELLLDDLLLHLARQVVPDRVRAVRRVEQEDGAGGGVLEHVDLVEELELVAGDEAGLLDQVGRADRPRAERRCETVIAPDFFES